ncbi:MAG: ABC transporter ATP-binding protein [Candidatus Aminicenantales bacterium]
MCILEVKNLSSGYGNGNVIQGVSFSLGKGEFVSILGKNGSGKSTLIKALQNLLRHTSGDVRIEGESIFSMNRRQMAKKIAYVPQISTSTFEFSVMEIVSMGRYIHQQRLRNSSLQDMEVIEEVMELTRISALREKKIAHLSGGERQRVFIARALAQNTPLFFLDEPSSHLDISYQIEIYRILKKLQEEKGKTILSTEHNINLAIPYSEKIIFLKDGRVHSQGPPSRLITRENIREVYEAEVEVRENIYSGLPEISLIPSGRARTETR